MLKKLPMTADLGIKLCRLRDREQPAVARIRIQLKANPISNGIANDFVFAQKSHPINTRTLQTH
jgi:hypothetical protein